MASSLIKNSNFSKYNLVINTFKNKFRFPNKLKGGRIERYVNYWKDIGNDYKQAIKDIFVDAKANRYKTYGYLSLMSFMTFLYKTNPSPNSYDSHLLEYQNYMSTVGADIRSKHCYDYLENINNLKNQKLLHKINFLFFTVYVKQDFNPDLKLYSANCYYLKPSYYDYIKNRIVDIGIINNWIYLDKMLKDFDVNPDEWKNER